MTKLSIEERVQRLEGLFLGEFAIQSVVCMSKEMTPNQKIEWDHIMEQRAQLIAELMTENQ